jgi:hypothetical protein
MGATRGVIKALTAARLGQRAGEKDLRAQDAAREREDVEARQRTMKEALEMALLDQRQAEAGATRALEKQRLTPRAPAAPRIDPLSDAGVDGYRKRREIDQQHARSLARFNQQNPTRSRPSGGTTHGQPKGGADPGSTETTRREKYFQTIADRAVAATGGDPSKAAEYIVMNPETAEIFGQGMDQSHIHAAIARAKQRQARGQKTSRFGGQQQPPVAGLPHTAEQAGVALDPDILAQVVERLRAGQGTLQDALEAFPPEYHDAIRRAAQGLR